MKKIFKYLLFLICFVYTKVYAYDVTFSEWSLNYPSEVDSLYIESEERYLWYKEEIVNEEFLVKEDIKDKLVDYSSFKIVEYSEKSLEKPNKLEDRIINEEKVTYSYDKIIGIKITGNIKLSEIELLERDTYNNVLLKNKDDYKFLFDGKYSAYKEVNSVILYFNDERNIDNILFVIYHDNDNSEMKVEYIVDSNYSLYENDYILNNKSTEINKDDLIKKSNKVSYYTYTDKLYKTYEIKKVYNDEYLIYLKDYIKDESTKKTYYRYVTSEYVYLCANNKLYTSHIYQKQFCKLTKVTKKKQKIVYNPQTIDTIYKDIILLIISLIATIIVFRRKIYLVLSKQFKVLKKYDSIF